MQQLKLKVIGPRTFELLERFDSECGVSVPRGFVTDGLSVPFYLVWIAYPTDVGFNASVVHDYLLSEKCTWSYSNKYFEKQLMHDNVPYWRIKAYVWGVKFWGFMHG